MSSYWVWVAVVGFCFYVLGFIRGHRIGTKTAMNYGIKMTLIFFYKFIEGTPVLKKKDRENLLLAVTDQMETPDGVKAVIESKNADIQLH
jgi:hypothetical protein